MIALSDPNVLQKDAQWKDVKIFCSGSRILGLDPATGERKILVEFPDAVQLCPGNTCPNGKLVLGWNTTQNPFARQIIIVGEECKIEKTIECTTGAAHIRALDDQYVFSDSAAFNSVGQTAFSITSILTGTIVRYETIPYFLGNSSKIEAPAGHLTLAVSGNEARGESGYILKASLDPWTEEKDTRFFRDAPYKAQASSMIGDTLILSFYDDYLVQFWSLSRAERLASFNPRELEPILGTWGTFRTTFAEELDGVIYLQVENNDDEEGKANLFLKFDAQSLDYLGATPNLQNRYPNNWCNTGYEGGLIFMHWGSNVCVYDIRTGEFLREDEFGN